MRDVVLAIDLGTSSLKAMLVDSDGAVVAEAAAAYPTASPTPQAAEQDPDLWWDALREVASRLWADEGAVAALRVAAIGLSGQMHGPVVLDAAGAVIRPCLLWSDSRSGPQAQWLQETIGRDRLIAITGTAANASGTVTKLLWMREHEPEFFARIRTVLLPKDHLRYRLTGRLASDPSDASGTSMLDIRTRQWSTDLLAACGLDAALLPDLLPSTAVAGHVTADAAAALRLPVGVPVVTGGGDALCAALAMGIDGGDAGRALVTLGTSGQLLVSTGAPAIDPAGRLNTFCHVVPDQWCALAATLSAGESLAWASRVASQHGLVSAQALLDLAATSPAGARGVLFAPYLSGERTPHMDAAVAGAFAGLRGSTDAADMVRAILEGVAFALRDGLATLRANGLHVEDLRGTGGGARSPLWCSILASVLGVPLAVPQPSHGSCYGAALLAFEPAGFPAQACGDAVSTLAYRPDPALADLYAARFRAYRTLYPGLKALAAADLDP
ncbi:xylulokinase [Lichenihabitans psoromatis]|uniref:xylulokinase n=1 Tax=Lichenihabitans psoromatis TaxID=2528642 RepID=UPI0010383C7C|nr:xylulokinase [Lichenihabitans psoromatis]